MTDEPWVARLMDHSLSSRQDAFTRAVRERDRKCVISGIPNLLADAGFWAGYQAARVFPLEHESVWIRNNSSRWISDADDAAGISNIDSVQNGLLMTHNFHTLFNQYFFSVNPDASNSMPGLSAQILTSKRITTRLRHSNQIALE